MIRDREDLHAVLRRERDEVARRERAVGRRRVGMEIDGAQAPDDRDDHLR